MNSHRASATRPAGLVSCAAKSACLVSYALLTLGVGCGGEEESPHLAPDTFAGKHIDELRNNCEQAIQCGAINGDLNQEEIEDDPREMCLLMSAEELNSQTPDEQLSFLVRYNTCATLTHCAYVTCATSKAMGFGEQQRPAIEHYCNARLNCDTVLGTFSGNAAEAFQYCVSHKIPDVNGYSSDRQQAFKTDFPVCSIYTSCDFFDCFHY